MKNLINICVASLLFVAFLSSCVSNEGEKQEELPVITFTDDVLVYNVKIGKEVVISPNYENVENASFEWILNEKCISTSEILSFSSSEVGDYYITIKVTNSGGSVSKEIKVSVQEMVLPSILLSVPSGGYTVAVDDTFKLEPVVVNSDNAAFLWTVNGDNVAETKDLSHVFEDEGTYNIVFTVKNDDGQASVDFELKVLAKEDMPVSWDMPQTEYNCALGRKIRLKLWNVECNTGDVFVWVVDGHEKQRGESQEFIFEAENEGTYNIVASLERKGAEKIEMASEELIVNVCAVEGSYKRAASSVSLAAVNKVYEYKAAPGQYINEISVYNTMQEACDGVLSSLNVNSPVNLGAFGGYVVLGFDHSIDNDGGYNLEILSNAYKGSSEPGIVSVMQDENGDGLPNDTWYELKGSETVAGAQISDYSITYYRQKTPKTDILWTDNKGKSGTVDYMGAYHAHDYYYPSWCDKETLIFYGTCLQPRIEETSPDYWVNGEYDWGYVDNYSLIDMFDVDKSANHFKISDAIDYKGDAVDLKYIDFVKIHTGVNAKAGWLGENSTEVLGVYDYNLRK